MKKANINSFKNYHVDDYGNIYNEDNVLCEGSMLNGVRMLNYQDENQKPKHTPFTRIVYATFYPFIDLKGRTVIRKQKGIFYEYAPTNLELVENSKMPRKNGLHLCVGNLKKGRAKFYENYNAEQLNNLKRRLQKTSLTNLELAAQNNTSAMSICRARKRLKANGVL